MAEQELRVEMERRVSAVTVDSKARKGSKVKLGLTDFLEQEGLMVLKGSR